MTDARSRFVEAAQYLVGYLGLNGDPRAAKRLSALCEAFADAECDFPGGGKNVRCPVLGNHAACRADLLEEIGL